MHPGIPAHVMWAGAYQQLLNNDFETAQRSENYAYLQANIGRMELERALVDVRCAHKDLAAQNVALRAAIEALEEHWHDALREHSVVASACHQMGGQP